MTDQPLPLPRYDPDYKRRRAAEQQAPQQAAEQAKRSAQQSAETAKPAKQATRAVVVPVEDWTIGRAWFWFWSRKKNKRPQ